MGRQCLGNHPNKIVLLDPLCNQNLLLSIKPVKKPRDIPNWPKPVPVVCIHCDSQAAIGRARNVMYNGKSRHIGRRHDTVRELLSSGIITIDYVKSKDNIADPLTKGLTREMVAKTSRRMGLRPLNKSS